MRLINIWNFELNEFASPPPYAILSHRWGEDEIKYEDYIVPSRRSGPGYEKVRDFCILIQGITTDPQNYVNQVPSLVHGHLHEDIAWAWVDTCCIDKRSSAELSESINSMWNWYRSSALCIAYLNDLPSLLDWRSHFMQSEWFRRGWTLQELLAPRLLVFCNAEWEVCGQKSSSSPTRNEQSFMELISHASGVPLLYLEERKHPHMASVAERMNWASQRTTTRKEDIAYCLFGLFNVYLPLLYGEGEMAFYRLQEEIIRTSNDESIFAWKSVEQYGDNSQVLADSPYKFTDSSLIRQFSLLPRDPFTVTHRGLAIRAELLRLDDDVYQMPLNCVELVAQPTSDVEMDFERRGLRARRCVLHLREKGGGIFEPCVPRSVHDESYMVRSSRYDATVSDTRLIYLRLFRQKDEDIRHILSSDQVRLLDDHAVACGRGTRAHKVRYLSPEIEVNELHDMTLDQDATMIPLET